MRYVNAKQLLLVCVMGLSSCATLGDKPLPDAPALQSQVEGPRLAPLDPELMQPEEPNFLDRLLNFLSPKPPAPTPLPGR